MKRTNIVQIVILVFLFINIFLGLYNIIRKKDLLNPIDLRNAINKSAPLFEAQTISGQKINLREYKNKYVFLQFTKFDLSELPYLEFVEHLTRKFFPGNSVLFYIDLLGKHDSSGFP
jgi:hypothetical protein